MARRKGGVREGDIEGSMSPLFVGIGSTRIWECLVLRSARLEA
ncbi:MAG: hypothetical protein AAGF11_11605 [Myxococcota bacterium]